MEYDISELEQRHSVRSYLEDPIPDIIRDRLKAEVTMINTQQAGLRFQLCFDDPAPFKGFRRSYGMFNNARNYLAAVIDPSFDNAEERAGYFAEQFVMKAVGLDLGTCFVSGTFSAKDVKAQMAVYERLPFIVVFGIPGGKAPALARMVRGAVHSRSLEPRDFFDGDDEKFEKACKVMPWLPVGLQGMAAAPSAGNRQCVRIELAENQNVPVLKACCKKGDHPVDLGIAKYNFQSPLPVNVEWEWGENGILQFIDE